MPHNACKGHREFRHNYTFFWQPAQIHVHVQMCLAGTSLYSVACFQTKFQVPLTALIRHLHFDDQYQYFVKHRKDGFYRKKKNRPLRTVTFHHMKINALRLPQNFLINFSPTSQSANSASEFHPHQEPQTGSTLHCPGSHDAYRFR